MIASINSPEYYFVDEDRRLGIALIQDRRGVFSTCAQAAPKAGNKTMRPFSIKYTERSHQFLHPLFRAILIQ
jgi:hypothetical protein